MKFAVTGKAFQIVKQHDVIGFAVLIEIMQQRHHAGAVHKIPATAGVIREDSFNFVAIYIAILAAAMLLAVQPVAFGFLLGVRHPAVNQHLRRRGRVG
ncbi:MAG: hypothetical protein SFZ03_10170 [Candidatus Melainabacteria bacterium]|nr:hypothetical protein [Candidatus Melainabacteria bacterium]